MMVLCSGLKKSQSWVVEQRPELRLHAHKCLSRGSVAWRSLSSHGQGCVFHSFLCCGAPSKAEVENPSSPTRTLQQIICWLYPSSSKKKAKPTPNKYSMIFARESLHKQKNAQIKMLGREVWADDKAPPLHLDRHNSIPTESSQAKHRNILLFACILSLWLTKCQHNHQGIFLSSVISVSGSSQPRIWRFVWHTELTINTNPPPNEAAFRAPQAAAVTQLSLQLHSSEQNPIGTACTWEVMVFVRIWVL